MHLKLNECNANDGDKENIWQFIPCICLTYKYTENSNITKLYEQVSHQKSCSICISVSVSVSADCELNHLYFLNK